MWSLCCAFIVLPADSTALYCCNQRPIKLQCEISEREQAHQTNIAQFIILTYIEVLHKVTFKVVCTGPQLMSILCIGSSILAPIISTGIWPDRRGGARAFYPLVQDIHTGHYMGTHAVYAETTQKHALKSGKKNQAWALTTFVRGRTFCAVFVCEFFSLSIQHETKYCLNKTTNPLVKNVRSTPTHLFYDANIVADTTVFSIPSSQTCQRFSTPPQAPDFLRLIFHVLFRPYTHKLKYVTSYTGYLVYSNNRKMCHACWRKKL